MKKKVIFILLGCFIMMPAKIFAQDSKSIFTYILGNFEVSLLSESQGQGNKSILIGATPEMLNKYAPDGIFPNAMNAFLVKTPDKNILVDAGLGSKLFDNLNSLGIDAGQIDIVMITHMHGDHIGGMIRDGKTMFPNAEVYLPQPEYDYWMSNDKFQQQQNVIEAYKDKLHLFQPNELGKQASQLIPGFKAFAAYGHTPGHSMYMLESDNKKLLIWGDVTHAMALQMPYPEVAVTYDVNPDDAIIARKKTLEYVSKYNIPIAGMHVAYPSIGSIAKNSSGGYVFIPEK